MVVAAGGVTAVAGGTEVGTGVLSGVAGGADGWLQPAAKMDAATIRLTTSIRAIMNMRYQGFL
jgi:hypothetical protein